MKGCSCHDVMKAMHLPPHVDLVLVDQPERGEGRDEVQVVLDLREDHLTVPLAQEELEEDEAPGEVVRWWGGPGGARSDVSRGRVARRRLRCCCVVCSLCARSAHLRGCHSFLTSRMRFQMMFMMAENSTVNVPFAISRISITCARGGASEPGGR